MRHTLRMPSFRSQAAAPKGACSRTAECQRLRVHDAARDHLARQGSDQAQVVARRTAATYR